MPQTPSRQGIRIKSLGRATNNPRDFNRGKFARIESPVLIEA